MPNRAEQPNFYLSSRATLPDKLGFSGLLRHEKPLYQKNEAVRQMPILAHRSALSENLGEEKPFLASYQGSPSMPPDADKILLDHFQAVRPASLFQYEG